MEASANLAEGLSQGEGGLVGLIDRGLREVEERLCRHVEESLRQLAQRADADREAQGAVLADLQRDLASQREGSQNMVAEVRRNMGAVEEVVYSKCRDLSRQLAALHQEQVQCLEQARSLVEGAEGSLKGQLKQYIDQLRGEMEGHQPTGSTSLNTSGLSEDRLSELKGLLSEERQRRETDAAVLAARVEALEVAHEAALQAVGSGAGSMDPAAAEERAAVEAQLTALCARLEVISREVTSRAPGAAPAKAGVEAELAARVEALEAACHAAATGGALRERLESLELQVSAMATTPRPAAGANSSCESIEAASENGGGNTPACAEKALAAKLAALERDQGVGAATSALSCGLARCIGEFDAELRVELKEKIDGLREELQGQFMGQASVSGVSDERLEELEGKISRLALEVEAKVKQGEIEADTKAAQAGMDSEARLKMAVGEMESRLKDALLDVEAKIATTKAEVEARIGQKEPEAEGSTELVQRVVALEGEARRTSYLITRCIGELSGGRKGGNLGGKSEKYDDDMQRGGNLGGSAAETATTASTATAAPGSASPGSVRAPTVYSGEELGISQNIRKKEGNEVGLGMPVDWEENHGWETPAPSQRNRLAAEVPGSGRALLERGLSSSASSPTPPSTRRNSLGNTQNTQPGGVGRGETTSIHSLPPGSFGRTGSPTVDVDTTRGSVCSSDTVPVNQCSPWQTRGLYGEVVPEHAQLPARSLDEVSSSGHRTPQEEAMPSRRRAVVVPVAATGRSMSPEMHRRGGAPRPQAGPPRQTMGSGASSEMSATAVGFDGLSPEERQRYFAEIKSLRRENNSLRDEVVDSREQALRQLRSNAERALRQQSGPEAEGPVVAAPGQQPPGGPLRAGFQRSVSPVPMTSRVHVLAQAREVASRQATPGRPGMMSPVQVEAMTARTSASPAPRRLGGQLSRVSSATWDA